MVDQPTESEPSVVMIGIVPVKSFSRAKSRLRLPLSERTEIAVKLATRTLGALRDSAALAQVVVVSDDPEVRRLAERFGCLYVEESSPGAGLNAAVRDATGTVSNAGTAVFVADLPLLDSRVVDQTLTIFASSGKPMFVADRAGTGTTVVYRPSGDCRMTHFGIDSAWQHRRHGYLDLRGAPSAVRTDLDEPCDLVRLRTNPAEATKGR